MSVVCGLTPCYRNSAVVGGTLFRNICALLPLYKAPYSDDPAVNPDIHQNFESQ